MGKSWGYFAIFITILLLFCAISLFTIYTSVLPHAVKLPVGGMYISPNVCVSANFSSTWWTDCDFGYPFLEGYGDKTNKYYTNSLASTLNKVTKKPSIEYSILAVLGAILATMILVRWKNARNEQTRNT